MKIQKTNNQQTFGMAWKIKTGGMKAEEIRAIIHNKALLDEAFQDADTIISMKYKDKFEPTSLPVGRLTKWCNNDHHYERQYSFESSPTNKSVGEKLKHLFGRGIIVKTGSRDTKELTKQDEFDVALKDAATWAKKNYSENPKVLLRAERAQLKAEKKAAQIEAAAQKKKALAELNIAKAEQKESIQFEKDKLAYDRAKQSLEDEGANLILLDK